MKKILKIINKLIKFDKKEFKIYHHKENKIIKEKTSKELKKFSIFFIKKGRIFTNSNEDAAYLKDNLVISTPSYQFRNSKNSNIKENFIFKSGIDRFKKKYKGRIISIITGGAAKNNYGHWLFDSISRLLLIRKITKQKNFNYLYVPSFKHQYQKDSLKYLNIPPKKIISSERSKYIEGSEIICTTHPFANRFDKISKPIINILQKNFLKFASLSKIKSYDKIYIERDYSSFNLKKNLSKYKDQRILINNKEIKDYLIKNGFKCFKLKYNSLADQIKIFSKAKIVVSMFGAELSNIIFCKKGTRIIEIKNDKKLRDFKNISINCGLRHTQINLKPLFKTKVIQNGIIKCKIDLLKNALK